MTCDLPEETGIVAALRDNRIDDALDAWKAFRQREGLCNQGLCENQKQIRQCCANRLTGWLLTAAMSEPVSDYKFLARRLEAWLDGRDDIACSEGDGDGGRIALTPALMIGHPEIDEDHRFLATCINRICSALEDGDFATVGRMLFTFSSSLDSHFQREEEIMESAGYRGLRAHSAAHDEERRNLRELQQMAEAVERGSGDKRDLGNRLVAFLLDDAIKADLGFKTFMIRHGMLD